MATTMSAEETARKEYKIWNVIGASSAGTVIEWDDFYIFGTLAPEDVSTRQRDGAVAAVRPAGGAGVVTSPSVAALWRDGVIARALLRLHLCPDGEKPVDRAVLGRFGRRQYLDDARPRRVGGAPAAGSSGCSGETVVTDLARHGAATIRATLAVGRPAVSLFPTSRALAVVELDSTGAATDEPWRPELGGPVNVGEIAGDAVIALPNHPSSRAFLVHGLTAREAVPQTTEVGLVSDSVERPSEALLREDGSAIVAGGVNDEAMVVSLLTDGRPNPAFGRDGVARWHHGPADVLHLNGVSGDRPSTMRRDSATIPS